MHDRRRPSSWTCGGRARPAPTRSGRLRTLPSRLPTARRRRQEAARLVGGRCRVEHRNERDCQGEQQYARGARSARPRRSPARPRGRPPHRPPRGAPAKNELDPPRPHVGVDIDLGRSISDDGRRVWATSCSAEAAGGPEWRRGQRRPRLRRPLGPEPHAEHAAGGRSRAGRSSSRPMGAARRSARGRATSTACGSGAWTGAAPRRWPRAGSTRRSRARAASRPCRSPTGS